jgi:RNA polymerase sigma factor (sigma-70 family)
MTRQAEEHKEAADEMLMVRYQRGSRDAFGTLVRRYAATVYSVGYYLLGSESAAEHLTRETFLQVIREAPAFHLESQFRTWLFGLLHRILAANTDSGSPESCRHDQNPCLSGGDESPGVDPVAPVSSQAYRSQLLARRVTVRVSGLPFAQREMFLFKQLGQLSLKDVALATGVDLDTTRHSLRVAFECVQQSVLDTEEYARALR